MYVLESTCTATLIVGYIATACCAIAALPQVINTIKTKSTEGVNLPTFSVLTLGFIFWFIEGLLMVHWPMIIGNAIGSVFQLIIIGYKIYNMSTHKEGRHNKADTEEEKEKK